MNKIGIHLKQVEEAMTLLDMEEVEGLVALLRIVRKRQGTVYVIGNGGSHATAGHFANDLMKMVRIPTICVGDMISGMTAYGNDTGWENMFYGPINEMVNKNSADAVIGISCSGNSENVIRALRAAAGEWGVLSAGLTGMSDGSAMSEMELDVLVHVRVPDIRVQEDLHLMICHAVVRALQEEEL